MSRQWHRRYSYIPPNSLSISLPCTINTRPTGPPPDGRKAARGETLTQNTEHITQRPERKTRPHRSAPARIGNGVCSSRSDLQRTDSISTRKRGLCCPCNPGERRKGDGGSMISRPTTMVSFPSPRGFRLYLHSQQSIICTHKALGRAWTPDDHS